MLRLKLCYSANWQNVYFSHLFHVSLHNLFVKVCVMCFHLGSVHRGCESVIRNYWKCEILIIYFIFTPTVLNITWCSEKFQFEDDETKYFVLFDKNEVFDHDWSSVPVWFVRPKSNNLFWLCLTLSYIALSHQTWNPDGKSHLGALCSCSLLQSRLPDCCTVSLMMHLGGQQGGMWLQGI